MKKKILYVILGLMGITLASSFVMWRLRNDKQDVWEQQNNKVLQSQESSGNPSAVPAQVQVHIGQYYDERAFHEGGIGPLSESELIYCVIGVEEVTDKSFDFAIREVVLKTQEVTLLLSGATAYFIEDGKKAVYHGEDFTLYFWFGDDQIDPIIGCMTITGMEKLENIRYLNTEIPGHEAN